MELSLQKADFHLLRGCCLEAERADMVSVHLEGLRQALPETYGGHLAMLVEEMRSSARVLRDLADLSQMHFNRVPILLNYLNIVLPLTHQSASPTWLQRKSNHRVWLKDVQLYVFCHRYRQQNQRKGQAGAFEINFVSDEGAKRFREVFAPAPEDTSEVSMEAIEDAK
ncbi:hypothetical protein Brms1b_003087 [Colletotrichum noveboracense]|nr:hypothetical protein Brms1b_003087 [Colletotrichum noveboracense]